jgi:hypothetical protein
LKNKEYVKEINKTISEIKEQYAALVYDRQNIDKIPLDELEFTISDQLFLDTLFMEIRKKINGILWQEKKNKNNN